MLTASKSSLQNVLQTIRSQPEDIQIWCVKALVGAVVADGVIHEGEMPYMNELLVALNTPFTMKIMRQCYRSEQPPELSEIQLPPELAKLILETVNEICLADHELAEKEEIYIQTVKNALGVEL